MKHKKAWPFNAPVDVKSLELDDYYDIVKQPMDFGTIHKRLNESYYDSVENVVSDIRLVFSNCHLYNDAEDEVVAMAYEVERFFETHFEKIKSKKSFGKNSGTGQS